MTSQSASEDTPQSSYFLSKTRIQAQVVLPIVASLSTIARVYLRKKYRIALKWDDYLMIAGQPVFWAYYAILLYQTTLTSLQQTEYLKALYGILIVGHISVGLIRLSIVLFYLRAFGTTIITRIVIYTLIGLSVAHSLIREGGSLLICNPISNYWNAPTHCSGSLRPYAIATEVIGIFTETAILLFPLLVISQLHHTSLRKKFAICTIFMLGAAVVASYGWRLYMIIRSFHDSAAWSLHATIENLVTSSLIEQGFGTLVGCLAATIAPLQMTLQSWLRRLRGSPTPPHSTVNRHLAASSKPSISVQIQAQLSEDDLPLKDISPNSVTTTADVKV